MQGIKLVLSWLYSCSLPKYSKANFVAVCKFLFTYLSNRLKAKGRAGVIAKTWARIGIWAGAGVLIRTEIWTNVRVGARKILDKKIRILPASIRILPALQCL